MNYLLSYNRSGNTWVRYILEYLTSQPTWGHEKFAISQRFDNTPIVLTSTIPIIIKRHEIIPDEIKKSDRIVFLLRDYKECIWNSMDCKYDNFEKEYKKYVQLLEFFENFKGRKKLFYYNNIFDDRQFIVTLIHFLRMILNIPNFWLKTNDFIENIKIHKDNCFSIYDNSINTKDKKSPMLSNDELQFIKGIVDGNYYSKYLLKFL